jgi:hypothetical protein
MVLVGGIVLGGVWYKGKAGIGRVSFEGHPYMFYLTFQPCVFV